MNEYYIKDTGLILITGNDGIDFLNRMSSNDLTTLNKGETRYTVLTSDKGRIIDLINIIRFDNFSILLCTKGYENRVISHLDKYIIMDDVKLEKKDNYKKVLFFGNNNFPLFTPGEESIPDTITYKETYPFKCTAFICKEDKLADIKNLLKESKEISDDEYEQIRISKGKAEGENEFNDNINPMECGLNKFISYTKGCYIGQEVIARLDAQGKRPKQMVIVKADEPVLKDDKIFPSEEQTSDKPHRAAMAGKEVGFVSSASQNTGLAFIRNVSLNYDMPYYVKRDDKKIPVKFEKIEE